MHGQPHIRLCTQIEGCDKVIRSQYLKLCMLRLLQYHFTTAHLYVNITSIKIIYLYQKYNNRSFHDADIGLKCFIQKLYYKIQSCKHMYKFSRFLLSALLTGYIQTFFPYQYHQWNLFFLMGLMSLSKYVLAWQLYSFLFRVLILWMWAWWQPLYF